ncbi:MAG: PAS domain S-box protein [Fibrobacter sp.]|nr:PAS domain S-box protein [Fibrobacter sp.]
MMEYNSILETFRTAIFDTINEPLVVLDKKCKVLSANNAFYDIFSISLSEALGKNIFEIASCFSDEKFKELLDKILPKKTTFANFELTCNFPNKGKRTFLLNAREVHGEHFFAMNIILLAMQDITDRKRWTDSILELNESLRTANAELERYGHALAHDLRAPVRAIAGFTKIILEEYETISKENIKEHLERIVHNADNMESMIVGLSQLAGITRASLKRYYLCLTDIAERIIADLKSSDPDREIEINIQQNMMDTVEPSLMLIALTNILTNSFKFTRNEKPAKINFGLKNLDGKKAYFIEDNGVGFDMKYVSKLFGMFQRLHSDKEYEGTGTGLAMVKTIIEKHGGEVWAYSEEGKGTTIYFTIGRD